MNDEDQTPGGSAAEQSRASAAEEPQAGGAAASPAGAGQEARSRLADRAARPVRVIRATFGALLTRIPLGAAIGMVAMLVAASLLSRGLGPGFIARTGAWSATAVLVTVGLVGGLILGATLAASRILDVVHEELRAWFERVPDGEQQRWLPSVPTEQIRSRYEGAVEKIFEQSVGRLPLPGPARAFVRKRFGHELAERFIADFERKGTRVVGFAELRDWLLVEGWSFATGPARLKINLWRALALGGMGILFAVSLAVGLLSGFTAATAFTATCGLLGVGYLVFGLRSAARHEQPNLWRQGVIAIAASVALWPLVYVQIWQREMGLAWVFVIAMTAATLAWGVKRAYVESDRRSASRSVGRA